jgi:hypothetical protein
MTAIKPTDHTERVALAPDLRSLSERGARAWTEQMAVRPLDGGYLVDSESGATYVVDPVTGTCTCPDQQLRGETCKHLRRVAIEITVGRVPPPGKRRGTCGACGVEAFVPHDESPPLCPTCRLEPGDVVLDRERDDRLVVVRVTDDRADEVTVPETDTTVAAYPTNEDYPADDLVVEAVYLSSLDRDDEPVRYRFPRSRLRPADDAAVLAVQSSDSR